MTLRLITPPAVLPVSLAELKAAIGLDGEDNTDDARLAGCLRSAVSMLDGAERLLGKALITQTWELTLPAFPYYNRRIDIPLPPLIEVASVAYVDLDGDEQTLAADQYQVVGIGGTFPGWIAIAHGMTWPAARWQDEALTITFSCGYGPSWNHVPEGLRQGLTAMATALFDGCHAEAAENMLSAYKTRVV